MNETRRKPTTGRQSPSLFDKWHGVFYMPSRIDEAGHTKAFDYPVAELLIERQEFYDVNVVNYYIVLSPFCTST